MAETKTRRKKRALGSESGPAVLREAFRLMCTAHRMAGLYEENRSVCRYVHSTSRGHEAIQLAVGMQLTADDYASLYYRDESVLLGIGLEPYELMLQLLARRDDPFTAGRSYYGHPALRREGFPKIPHQSAATGMQAIPATGIAQGIAYLESRKLTDKRPLVLCSLGDGSVTEGEVAEAFQMAVLKKLPVLYLVQDNGWGISAKGSEMRAMDAYTYAGGFPGMERFTVDGADFLESWAAVAKAMEHVRTYRRPCLLHARCPLLGHHTSGVRREWYREDLESHRRSDPLPRLRDVLVASGLSASEVDELEQSARDMAERDFQRAVAAPEPDPATFESHEFAPTPVTGEQGTRTPEGAERVNMVDAALHAIDDILRLHPEAVFYGQDVGRRLGGVFREAATLAAKYGDERVFNTPIQEAYIVGSTVGMSAAGVKPVVEIQFGDYFWPAFNQLVVELSKSCFLTAGKYPVQALIRVPVGAYGGGGPYHSACIASTLLSVRGVKIVYPSNAADIKGLMKAAFYDPNPVIMLEHKGLYWSKLPGTEDARTIEPDADYIIPLGKARVVQMADEAQVVRGISMVVITWGMGVYWAQEASRAFPGQVEIIDLRTLYPLDWTAIVNAVSMHGRVMILTEEPLFNSFAESLAGRIAKECFQYLDAPPWSYGALDLPAVPLNINLEAMMLPNADKVREEIRKVLEC